MPIDGYIYLTTLVSRCRRGAAVENLSQECLLPFGGKDYTIKTRDQTSCWIVVSRFLDRLWLNACMATLS